MRRKVESPPKASPVDAHERTRDYLSEEELALLLQGTPRSRYRWRNAAMPPVALPEAGAPGHS